MSDLPALPRGWAWSTVEEVGEVQLGRQRSPEHHQGEHMRPYLRVANVYEDRIDLSDVMEMNFTPAEFEAYRLSEGDILLNEGQSRELVGRPAMYRGELPGACFTNSLVRFRPRSGILAPFALELFRHYLRSGRFQQIAKITTNIAHLGAGRFAKVEFPVPPTNEQRRIVAKIEALTARSRTAREALEQVPLLLERFRQSVLAAAFCGDLTAEWRRQHPDVEPASVLLERIRAERRRRWEEAELASLRAKGKVPGNDKWKAEYPAPRTVDASSLPDLPHGWCWASLEELASDQPRAIQSGPFGSALKHDEFQSEGVLVIGIDNVLNGSFSMGSQHRISAAKFEELARFQARPLDVLITVMATVGRCCVVPADIETAIVTKHVYRITVERRLLDPHCLMYALLGAAEVRRQLWGSVQGQTRAGINGTILKGLAVPLPPLAEQRALLEAVRRGLADAAGLAGHVAEAASAIARLDQSILAKAFRGELVPHDPNDEPASVLLDRIRADREAAGADGIRARRGRRLRAREAEPTDVEDEPEASAPAATHAKGTNGNGSILHAVLGALKREALHRIADAEGVELADRRSLHAARAGVIDGGVTLAAALEHLDRDELKAVCRALGLNDRGKTKAELRDRVLTSKGVPA